MLTLNASRTPRLVIAAVLLLPLLVSGCWFAAAGGVAAAGGGGGGGGDGVVNLAPSASLADPGRLDQPEEQLTFTVADGNNDLVDLDVSFQLQGSGVTPATLTGATVATASPITTGGTGTVAPAAITIENGNVVTGIPATAAGVEVVVTWALGTDVNLNVASPGPSLIFGVTDGKVAVEPVVQQDDGSIIGNDAPTVDKVTTSGNTGNIVVSAEVADSTDDEIDLIVEFSTDNFVADIRSATIVVGATESLAAPITSTTHTVSWGSDSDLNLVNLANISIRVRALDATAEGSSESAAFTVINNQPPTAALGNLNTRLPGNTTGDITVPLTLANAEENAEAISVSIEFSTDDFDADIRSATILESTTGLITSVTGTNFLFTWDTDTDLGANALGGVRLRFNPTDTFQTGSTVVSPLLDVLNDAPTVTIQTPPITDTTGNPLPSVGQVPIGFLLVDSSTGDRSSVSVEFSLNGTFSDAQAATLIGATNGLPGAPGGIPHAVSWDSVFDVGFVNLASVSLRVTATDQFNAQSTPVATSFELLNNDGPIVDIDPVIRQDGDFIINYTLSDQQGDDVDVDVKFNLDNGTQFSATPAASNTEGVTGLSSSQVGESHVFVWDSATDLGAGATTGVTIVITPSDAQSTGQSDLSNAFTVGNDAPVIQNLATPAGEQTGNIAIQFDLADTTADSVDLINVEFSTDDFGADIRSATLIGGNPNNLATSATGLQQTVVWISDGLNQLPGERQETVKMRFQVRDAASVPGAEDSLVVTTNAFVVDNNTAPRVIMSELALNFERVGRTVLEFTVFDDESDSVDVVLQWQTQGDAFPTLGSEFDDAVQRNQALADPNQRDTLQVLSEFDRDFVGVTAVPATSLANDEIQTTSILTESTLVDPSTLTNRSLHLLRSLSPATLVGSLATPGPVLAETNGSSPQVSTALVALQGSGELVRIDLASGNSTTIETTLGNPTDMALEPSGESVLVVDNLGGRLVQVSLIGDPIKNILTGLTAPFGVAVVSSRTALVTAGSEVLKVDLINNTQTSILSGLSTPEGIVVSLDGHKAFIAERTAQRITELDLISQVATPLTGALTGNPTSPQHLALRADGRQLLISTAQGGSSQVLQLDLINRRFGALFGGIDTPGGLDAGLDGTILITEKLVSGNLLARGGIQQVRTVTAVTLSSAKITLDAPLQPAVTGRQSFVVKRGLNPTLSQVDATLNLASSPTGVTHRLSWDVPVDGIPQSGVQVAATPFDQNRGLTDVAQVSKTLLRFEDQASTEFKAGGETVTAADLDGDAALEILIGDSSQVKGFSQTQPGVFVEDPDILLTGLSIPRQIVTGDIDADGDIDIIVASEFGDAIKVFRQTAVGVFETTASISLADPQVDGPVSIAIGDVDNDGDLDIASANEVSDSVTIFRQLAPGTFEPAPFVVLTDAAMDKPNFVVLGDVDLDGDLDLAVTNDLAPRNNAMLFIQTAPGVFAAPITRTPNTGGNVGLGSVHLVDIDSDGLVDIVQKDSDIVAFRQTAPGTFETTASIVIDGNGAGRAVVADLDGDGDLDTVEADFSEDRLVVTLQTSPGVFNSDGSITLPATARTQGAAVGDLDGDGDIDILSANSSTSDVTMFEQLSPGNYESIPGTIVFTFGTNSVAFGDLNSDGLLDLLACDGRPNIFFQNSPGVFDLTAGITFFNAGFVPRDPVIADIDGDGDKDIATANEFSDDVTIPLQTAPGVFDTVITLEPGLAIMEEPVSLVMEDIDGDGDLDAVSANRVTNNVTVFRQTSAGVFESIPSIILTDATISAPSSVRMGDIDGDGDLDIVVANKDSNNVTVFRQTATGVFEASPSITITAGADVISPVSLALADVDGDGDIDITTANTGSKNITVFLQSTPGVFPASPDITLTQTTPVPQALAIFDLDGDGDLDIGSTNSTVDGVTVYRQLAPGLFEATPFVDLVPGDGIMNGSSSIAVADVDGDGDVEIAAGSGITDTAVIFSISGEE